MPTVSILSEMDHKSRPSRAKMVRVIQALQSLHQNVPRSPPAWCWKTWNGALPPHPNRS